MRHDPVRLDLHRYPFRLDVQSRFGDMDALRHLNNVAIGRFYEEGRVRFSETFRDLREEDGRVVVGRVAIDYLREGFYPKPLVVGTGVLSVGGASYTYGQALFQDQVCIGLAESVLVYSRNGSTARLPDDLRDVLATVMFNATPSGA